MSAPPDSRPSAQDPAAIVPEATRRARTRFRHVSVVVLALYVLVAVIGPLLVQYDPVGTDIADRLLPPGARTASGTLSLLGTDALGREMAAQLVYGARTSLTIGVCVVAISSAVGVALGTIAGYFGGWIDVIISRLIDVLMAFPGILLSIVITGLFDRGMTVVVLALSAASWIGFARLSRGLALSFRERPWVDAARVVGISAPMVLAKHVAPFVLGPVVALATTEFALAVLAEAGLSFLGLGLPSSSVSWGQVVANGRDYLDTAWWISVLPGITLAILVICAGALGDRLSTLLARIDR